MNHNSVGTKCPRCKKRLVEEMYLEPFLDHETGLMMCIRHVWCIGCGWWFEDVEESDDEILG